jgi:UPF0755 protein
MTDDQSTNYYSEFTDEESPMTNEPHLPLTSTLRFRFLTGIVLLLLLVPVGFLMLNVLRQAPQNFPISTPIVIEPGTSTKEIATILKNSGVIRSELLFKATLVYTYKGQFAKAGTYTFETPQDVETVIQKLIAGDFNHDLITLTLIEGEDVRTIAKKANSLLTEFNEETFLELALPSEGTLFPETYFIPKDYTAEELFTLLTNTFTEKINTFENDILNLSLTINEIVILASIIEREANTKESMAMVSGILQNRLAIGMALQVDATMEYVINKPLSELTPEDLEIDSPYNTYLYPGLPPTPIGNPGLDAIYAAIHPKKSTYLFYITGSDGEFYYAENFDQHRMNIARHLR